MKWLEKLIDKYYAAKQERRLEQIEKDAESKRCKGCEVLEKELNIAHQRIDQLMELLHPADDKKEIDKEDFQPINRSRFVPWNVRRQQLENRNKREKDLATDQSVEKLEKELGITENG